MAKEGITELKDRAIEIIQSKGKTFLKKLMEFQKPVEHHHSVRHVTDS